MNLSLTEKNFKEELTSRIVATNVSFLAHTSLDKYLSPYQGGSGGPLLSTARPTSFSQQ